jgi:hypothetical protein
VLSYTDFYTAVQPQIWRTQWNNKKSKLSTALSKRNRLSLEHRSRPKLKSPVTFCILWNSRGSGFPLRKRFYIGKLFKVKQFSIFFFQIIGVRWADCIFKSVVWKIRIGQNPFPSRFYNQQNIDSIYIRRRNFFSGFFECLFVRLSFDFVEKWIQLLMVNNWIMSWFRPLNLWDCHNDRTCSVYSCLIRNIRKYWFQVTPGWISLSVQSSAW